MPSGQQVGPKVDADGYILEGRFAGRHISTILQYAESLESAFPEDGKPPKEPPAVKPPTGPDAELERHAAGRVDAAALLTAQRFRADDEAAFREKIGPDEWKKVEKSVKDVVDKLPVDQWLVRGIHWTVYVQLKAHEPEFESRLLGKGEPPKAPTETPEAKAEREAREAADAEARKIEEARALLARAGHAVPEAPVRGPKATPPTVPPTPGRPAEQGARKPKLVPNEKVRRAAREWGMSTDDYLLKLEDAGTVQEDLERLSTPKEETRRRTVFDRPVAGG